MANRSTDMALARRIACEDMANGYCPKNHLNRFNRAWNVEGALREYDWQCERIAKWSARYTGE